MSGTPQTQAQLLAAFSDSDPAGSITPETMRNFVASVPIIANAVGWSLKATGTNLATALALSQAFNYFSVVPVSSGASLPLANLSVGGSLTVWNNGANPLLVYAQTGDTIITFSGSPGTVTSVPVSGEILFTALAAGYWFATAVGATSSIGALTAAIAALPTTLPASSGVLWLNGGVVCLS